MATEQSTIDKITSWAGAKYKTAASPALAPTVSGGTGWMNSDGTGGGTMFKSQASIGTPGATSGGTGTMNSDGSGTGTMFKSQPSIGTPTAVTAPQGMLGIGSTPAPAAAAPTSATPTGMLGATSVKPATDYSSQLNDLYKSTLKRDGDAAGMAWYADKLNSGATTIDGVRTALMQSDEWKKANQPNSLPTPTSLTARTVDAPTETVQGQLGKVLAADSPVLQHARAEGMRTAFDRGLGNSSIAASAGADALTRAATGIATTDAGTYGDAASYNTTAQNQLFMYDRDQVNQDSKLDKQLAADAAGRAQQMQIAQMGDATTRAGQSNQMTISQMQDATTRWNTEQSTANSRYNTDLNYKKDVDNQKLGVANNIIGNMDMSPDRKAAMLEQLGFGTSAQPGVPGTGLAGAVYVIDSVGADLRFDAGAADAGGLGGIINSATASVVGQQSPSYSFPSGA